MVVGQGEIEVGKEGGRKGGMGGMDGWMDGYLTKLSTNSISWHIPGVWCQASVPAPQSSGH